MKIDFTASGPRPTEKRGYPPGGSWRFTIKSDYYNHLCSEFKSWLHALGYSGATQQKFLTGIRELLGWLEANGIGDVSQADSEVIGRYKIYLETRPNYVRGGGLSASTITSKLYVCSLFFSSLTAQGRIRKDPMSGLFYEESVKRRENLLSVQDIKTVYVKAETAKDTALLSLLYGCGLRLSEAISLDVGDVNLRTGFLYVRPSKNGQSRTVPLSSRVKEGLQSYLYKERSEYVAPRYATVAFMLNSCGRRMQAGTYRKRLRYLLDKSGITQAVSCHHLRHAIATHLLASGMELEQVKDFLGHSKITTTQAYTHISADYLKQKISYEATDLSERPLPSEDCPPVLP